MRAGREGEREERSRQTGFARGERDRYRERERARNGRHSDPETCALLGAFLVPVSNRKLSFDSAFQASCASCKDQAKYVSKQVGM